MNSSNAEGSGCLGIDSIALRVGDLMNNVHQFARNAAWDVDSGSSARSVVNEWRFVAL